MIEVAKERGREGSVSSVVVRVESMMGSGVGGDGSVDCIDPI